MKDKITVTSKLKNYINIKKWPEQMYGFIGKSFEAKEYDLGDLSGVWIFTNHRKWYIPQDCYIYDRIRKIDMILNETK